MKRKREEEGNKDPNIIRRKLRKKKDLQKTPETIENSTIYDEVRTLNQCTLRRIHEIIQDKNIETLQEAADKLGVKSQTLSRNLIIRGTSYEKLKSLTIQKAVEKYKEAYGQIIKVKVRKSKAPDLKYTLRQIHNLILNSRKKQSSVLLQLKVSLTALHKHLKEVYDTNYQMLKKMTPEQAEEKYHEIYDEIIENTFAQGVILDTLTLKQIHNRLLKSEWTLCSAAASLGVGPTKLRNHFTKLGIDYDKLRTMMPDEAESTYKEIYNYARNSCFDLETRKEEKRNGYQDNRFSIDYLDLNPRIDSHPNQFSQSNLKISFLGTNGEKRNSSYNPYSNMPSGSSYFNPIPIDENTQNFVQTIQKNNQNSQKECLDKPVNSYGNLMQQFSGIFNPLNKNEKDDDNDRFEEEDDFLSAINFDPFDPGLGSGF